MGERSERILSEQKTGTSQNRICPNSLSFQTGKCQNRKCQNRICSNSLSHQTEKYQNRRRQNGTCPSPNSLSCKTGKCQNGKCHNGICLSSLSLQTGKSPKGKIQNGIWCDFPLVTLLAFLHLPGSSSVWPDGILVSAGSQELLLMFSDIFGVWQQ